MSLHLRNFSRSFLCTCLIIVIINYYITIFFLIVMLIFVVHLIGELSTHVVFNHMYICTSYVHYTSMDLTITRVLTKSFDIDFTNNRVFAKCSDIDFTNNRVFVKCLNIISGSLPSVLI